jgi:DNA-binding CsgD family transcriptional regulator
VATENATAPMAQDQGVDDEWFALLATGGEPVRHKIAQLPYDQWSRDPGLLLAFAASYRWEGLQGAYLALPHLDAAEHLLAAHPSPPPRYVAAAALLRGTVDRTAGRITASLERIEEGIAVLRSPVMPILDRIDMDALAVLKRGASRVFTGDLDAARRDLQAGLMTCGDRLPASETAEALGYLAIVDILAGSLRAADRGLRRAEALVRTAPSGLWSVPAEVARLLLAAERGELDDAAAAVDHLLDRSRGTEFEPLALHIYTLLSVAREEWDDAIDAIHHMREIERDWSGAELLRLLRISDQADVNLGLGDIAEVRSMLATEEDPRHIVCANALEARIALEIGDFSRAVDLTRSCLAMGVDHPVRSHLCAALLDAGAHWALGDMRSADASFRLVLKHIHATRARRMLAALPPRILQGLLVRASDRPNLLPAERALVSELTDAVPELADPVFDVLSPRERIILRRISAGETPKEVALSLHVSMNTIKTQLRSIYRKLGVSSRAGAIERARVLGMLAA